ncbi:MAG: ABC transporter ATP-binding protein [Deltaproteobacteria bacterium]|nr:ABC transporter ATP-binding protein [Deltaproteobacteria bacterium]
MPEPSPSSERTSILTAEDVSKVYQMGDVEVHALRGVNVPLYEGELMVLLGPSGSGKSTLLNIVGALDVPTSGRVLYRGDDIARHGERELTNFRRNHVGFVFQFYNLVPSLTARENIALVTEIAQTPLDPREALELVGLTERMDHFPAQLSGGEQQRVAIARAVAKQPEILLCDEPTGALDFKTGIRVLEVIDEVNRSLGTTTAVITHHAPIASMADRVVSLADGMVASDLRNDEKVSPAELTW